MPQSSLTYAVARVKALEGRLIQGERLERLMEQPNAQEALNLLNEYGYGAHGSGVDYESLVQNELTSVAQFVEKVTPDETITDLFLMRGDYQNLKALMKMDLAGQRNEEALTYACKIPPERLQEALSQRAYYILPSHLQSVAAKAETLISMRADPRELDMLLDSSYLVWANEQGAARDKYVGKYFAAMVDFYNAALALRSGERGQPADSLWGVLLSGGRIRPRLWIGVLNQPEAMSKLSGHYGMEFVSILEEVLQHKTYWCFENWRDKWLADYIRKGRDELFSILPLLAYLQAKENEGRAVRMVMVAKTNDLGADIVRERLRGLYA